MAGRPAWAEWRQLESNRQEGLLRPEEPFGMLDAVKPDGEFNRGLGGGGWMSLQQPPQESHGVGWHPITSL